MEFGRKSFVAATAAIYGSIFGAIGYAAGGSHDMPFDIATIPSSVGLGLGAAAFGLVTSAVLTSDRI